MRALVVHNTAIDILKAHCFARLVLNTELTVRETFPILEAITRLDLAPARIDLGKLTIRVLQQVFDAMAGWKEEFAAAGVSEKDISRFDDIDLRLAP